MSILSYGPRVAPDADNPRLRSVIYRPDDDPNAAGRCLVVFLHGRGESHAAYPDAAAAAVVHGPLYRRHWTGWQPDFVTLCPQLATAEDRWHQQANLEGVTTIVDQVLGGGYGIDPNRVVVAGFSIGGLGCYALGAYRQNVNGWHIRKMLPVDPYDTPPVWNPIPGSGTINVPVWQHHRNGNRTALAFVGLVQEESRRAPVTYEEESHPVMGRECFNRQDIYDWMTEP